MNLSKNSAINLTSINNKLIKFNGMLEANQNTRKEVKKTIKRAQSTQLKIMQAVRVIQEVAKATQDKLEAEISGLVTAAIQAIFKENHSLKISFEMKRNKTEAEIFVTDEQGHEIDLFNDDAGGLRDIVTFTLRLACWRVKVNKPAPVFLFDEPWKNLSKQYRPAAIQFMMEISKKLNTQIIMITHIDEFIDEADKVIRIG